MPLSRCARYDELLPRLALGAVATIAVAIPLAAAQGGVGSLSSSRATREAALGNVNEEGLERRKVEGLQSVYARPGATLKGYSRILLDPVEVSFARDWDPQVAGRPIPVADRERIRSGMAALVREEFVKELQLRGQYAVVEESGEDVLRVRVEIRDLYVNAPDIQTASRMTQYSLSAGEMTLVGELRDSATGALLGRVFDRREDPENFQMERTSSVENVAAARRIARRWAEILHRQLDQAREAIVR
jgi:hypothetical protein